MPAPITSRSFTAIDLFAGGGGLTVGLKRAGFHVVGAVENAPYAAATYKANNPDTTLFETDIRSLHGDDFKALSSTGSIDLISGCPPCQGFTSLTAKYKREDPRNSLILEMLRLTEDIMPKAIMLENVPGLQTRGHDKFAAFVARIKELGYIPTIGILQVADYGVPQSRKRLVLLAGKGFIIPMPKPSHSQHGGSLPQWRTVRDTIFGHPSPMTLSMAKNSGRLKSSNWNIVRDLSPANLARLRAAVPGRSWYGIPEKLRPDCHHGEYRGFPNVYGRMEWDKVSPTITGGCTTLSRGRYGHPDEDRTISVREAALLQTFPEDYKFESPFMDAVCNIVGNALPCLFAYRLAEQCHTRILQHFFAG